LHRVIAIHQKSLDIQSREPFLLLHIFHTPPCCYPHNLKAQCTHASHLLYRSPCFKRRHSHTLNYLPPSRIIKTHRITTTNRIPQNHRRNFIKKNRPSAETKPQNPQPAATAACRNQMIAEKTLAGKKKGGGPGSKKARGRGRGSNFEDVGWRLAKARAVRARSKALSYTRVKGPGVTLQRTGRVPGKSASLFYG
jgi:hypothetical protein